MTEMEIFTLGEFTARQTLVLLLEVGLGFVVLWFLFSFIPTSNVPDDGETYPDNPERMT